MQTFWKMVQISIYMDKYYRSRKCWKKHISLQEWLWCNWIRISERVRKGAHPEVPVGYTSPILSRVLKPKPPTTARTSLFPGVKRQKSFRKKVLSSDSKLCPSTDIHLFNVAEYPRIRLLESKRCWLEPRHGDAQIRSAFHRGAFGVDASNSTWVPLSTLAGHTLAERFKESAWNSNGQWQMSAFVCRKGLAMFLPTCAH